MKRAASFCFYDFTEQGQVRAVRGHTVNLRFRRHTHSAFCIGLVARGTRHLHLRRQIFTVPTGSVFLLNPGESHSCSAPSGKRHDYLVLAVDASRMQSVASRISGTPAPVPYFARNVFVDSEIAREIWRFFNLMENPSSRLELESTLLSLLGGLILRHAQSPPPLKRTGRARRLVQRARHYLEKNWNEKLTLAQIAQSVSLSPFYLQRIFLEEYGVSPHEYLLQTRIKAAQRLLLAGEGAASVAAQTGFVDQAHFTRFFKRMVGVTPGKFRDSHHWYELKR